LTFPISVFTFCKAVDAWKLTCNQWKKNVKDINGEVLCVSQFTLLASTKKGSKPDFHKSAGPDKGKELYSAFFKKVQDLYEKDKVKDGVFQAMMDVGESAPTSQFDDTNGMCFCT
jgi:D-tyrosyl-tRNA(Tyr) deacylase